MVSRLALALTTVVALAGCKPEPEGRASLVTEPRVLAIRSEPAEAAKGQVVKLSMLLAADNGAPVSELRWYSCGEPKPLAAPGTVSLSCLKDPDSTTLTALPKGTASRLTLSEEVCGLFGPNPPTPQPGEPPRRAGDPDPSGGYYQPVRLDLEGELSLGFVRLDCGLGAVSQENSLEWTKRHRINTNPELAQLRVRVGAGEWKVVDLTSTLALAPDSDVEFEASWATCPTSDRCGDGICGIDDDRTTCSKDCGTIVGCTGAERFLLMDPVARELTEARETLRLSWFATDGSFERDGTGRRSDERETTTQNGYHTPAVAGPVSMWFVLRDNRGGVGWAQLKAVVTR